MIPTGRDRRERLGRHAGDTPGHGGPHPRCLDRDRRALVDLVLEEEAVAWWSSATRCPSTAAVGRPPWRPRPRPRRSPACSTATGSEVELFDERLTTVSAHQALTAGEARGRDQRAVVDQTAAAVMLMAWLDGRRRGLVTWSEGTARRCPRARRGIRAALMPAVPDDAVGPHDGTGPGRGRGGRPRPAVDPHAAPTGARGPRRTRHPWRIAALAVIVVGIIVLVGGYLWVQHEADPSGPQGAEVIVTVPDGSGENATGSLLADNGVIGSSLAFQVWSQFNSLPGIRAGSYAFRRNSSFGEVQALLATGPNVFPLVVPPGFTVSEVRPAGRAAPGPRRVGVPDRLATDGIGALALAAGRGDQPRGPARHRAPTRCCRGRPTTSYSST